MQLDSRSEQKLEKVGFAVGLDVGLRETEISENQKGWNCLGWGRLQEKQVWRWGDEGAYLWTSPVRAEHEPLGGDAGQMLTG